jgi:hypothetical protein
MDECVPGFPGQDKFSNEEEVIAKLVKFIYWLAGHNANPDNVMMSFDEIVGELFVEIVKGLDKYGDLPEEELEAVLRKMMDNRISELKYKFYVTHRKFERSLTIAISDAENNPDEYIGSDHTNPASVSASKERVRRTRDQLSPTAKEVFDMLIFGDDRLNMQLNVSNMRAKSVYKDFKVKVRPFHIANALRISEAEVVDAYDEIREAYKTVET